MALNTLHPNGPPPPAPSSGVKDSVFAIAIDRKGNNLAIQLARIEEKLDRLLVAQGK